jgi:hypothetical protein
MDTRVERRESTRTVERTRTVATRILEGSEIARNSAQPVHPARVEAAPEPNIQISIGRVEVRAAAPAPVQSRAAKRSPVMALDDYLDRRNRKSGR